MPLYDGAIECDHGGAATRSSGIYCIVGKDTFRLEAAILS